LGLPGHLSGCPRGRLRTCRATAAGPLNPRRRHQPQKSLCRLDPGWGTRTGRATAIAASAISTANRRQTNVVKPQYRRHRVRGRTARWQARHLQRYELGGGRTDSPNEIAGCFSAESGLSHRLEVPPTFRRL
jgi:hypothetical protein